MTELKAVYENGVLRPLEPVPLQERQEVTLTISEGGEDLLDAEFLETCRAGADPSVSLQTVRDALAKIPGTLTDDIRAERDER
jgi:predicted DNA-binding antitoxin AbrB/MazE fold protein